MAGVDAAMACADAATAGADAAMAGADATPAGPGRQAAARRPPAHAPQSRTTRMTTMNVFRRFFRDLAVSLKLALSFGLVLVLLAGVGVFSSWQLDRLRAASAQVAQVHLPGVRESLLMSELASRYRTLQYRLVAVQARERPAVAQAMKSALQAFDAHRARYAAGVVLPEERALLDQAAARWAAYAQLSQAVEDDINGGMAIEAKERLGGEGETLFQAAAQALQQLAAYNDRQATEAASQGEATHALSRRLLVFTVVFSIGLAAVLAFLVSRSITVPLARAVALAQRVAAGDLTMQANDGVSDARSDDQGMDRPAGHRADRRADRRAERGDEVGRLDHALGVMVQRLSHLVLEVRKGVESVNIASTEIASGNMDLSDRTQLAAARLQATASRMEAVTHSVASAASTADRADRLAQQAIVASDDGRQVVDGVIQSMGEISDSSRRIAEIIGVIDGIAFQTNVLALNAAVEAARAGEQGRGFAVVAGEVRTLAQRSAVAAKEIKQLIQSSVGAVKAGVAKVGSAHASMESIRAAIEQVTALMAELNGSSRAQQDSVKQINEAISALGGLTQQNSALVEESAAAAAMLRDQAASLQALVAVFRVSDDAGDSAAAHACDAAPAELAPRA
jgi:methyl-accepting chemotaxis protein